MLVVCPNCKKEFIIGEEVIGNCPSCGIKLIFRKEGEVVEKVNISEIEKRVDELTEEGEITDIDRTILDLINAEEILIEEIERKIDDL